MVERRFQALLGLLPAVRCNAPGSRAVRLRACCGLDARRMAGRLGSAVSAGRGERPVLRPTSLAPDMLQCSIAPPWACRIFCAQPRRDMRNPWLKKNPFMSMWMSEANSIANSIRGQAAAQVKRHAATAMTDATNDLLGVWTRALSTPPPTRTNKKHR